MRRALLAVICMTVLIATMPSPSRSAEGRCLIAVDGGTRLNGRCNIEIRADGSFTVGIGDKSRSKYFAYVDLDRGTDLAHGYWNGIEAESHAHEDLGMLKKNGACWQNARARICAWR